MLGAIIGDISGSRFEWDNIKSKEFDFFAEHCRPTDDSRMTLAVAKAFLLADGDWSVLSAKAIETMHDFGYRYPFGYGPAFKHWLLEENPEPYGSFGNGAAMRVSPCAWVARSMEEAMTLSDLVTGISHDHPEGLKGARATTSAIFLARNGSGKEEIRNHIQENYYPLDFTIDGIRPDYRFDASCQGSVPQAIEAFLESTGFEDAVRNAISIGGDSDTIAAIAGSIAEAFYGIPEDLRERTLPYLDEYETSVLFDFERKYGPSAG